MIRSLIFLGITLLPSIRGMAQLPGMDDRDASGRQVAYRPFLGRIATYNEIFGLGVGYTFNVEASPLMTDAVTINLRIGSGRQMVVGYQERDGFSMVYGVGAEFGRRRSRIALAGGLWNVVVPPYVRPKGTGKTDAQMRFNAFSSVGYRYQAPKGFFFGLNVYFMAADTDYLPTFADFSRKHQFSIWPGTFMGYRLPSSDRHRELKAHHKLSKSERHSLRQQDLASKKRVNLEERLPDSAQVTAASRSEFGLTVFGPALAVVNYTLYVPLKPGSVPSYYLRSGIGTAMPLFQWNMETGMALLKNNSGLMLGGGGALSFGSPSLEAFIVARGKVNVGKGFSANAGLMVLWSTGVPYTFIGKRRGAIVLPSIGFAYRLPKRSV
jgi:hypothetical protein